MLDRHAVQKVLDAGVKPRAVARQFRVSRRTLERVAREAGVRVGADGVLGWGGVADRRPVGRPRVTEAVRARCGARSGRSGVPAGRLAGRAIVASAIERGLRVPASSEFAYEAGRGVHATVEGRHLAAGGPNMLSALDAAADTRLLQAVQAADAKGQSTVFLVEERRVLAAFAVADAVRPSRARLSFVCTTPASKSS